MQVGTLPAKDRSCRLDAHDGSRHVASLTIKVLQPRLLHTRLEIVQGEDVGGAGSAFARVVTERWGGTQMQILDWERETSAAWRRALEDEGWETRRRKAFVRRDLTGTLPEPEHDLVLTPLRDVHESVFLDRLTLAAEGDPFEDEEFDPEREWSDLKRHAGERFDPANWFLADDTRGPVGVVLPQAYDDDEGSIFYVGVVPSRRDEGLGRALHATGLHELARRGLTKYVGSTDVRNAAMLRVFEANGCAVTGLQLFLGHPGA